MSRLVIDTTDHVARLRQRLGGSPKRWKFRIKFGGWISLTPPMLISLHFKLGDVIEWKLTPRGVDWQRKSDKPGAPLNRLRQPRPLGKNETVIYASRPSYRHRYSGSPSAPVLSNDAAARNTTSSSGEEHTAAVFRGSTMRFQKRPRVVSVKHLAMNFERFFDEVMLGRVIQIKPRCGEGCAFMPIALKERIARKRKPLKKAHVSHKPSKRW